MWWQEPKYLPGTCYLLSVGAKTLVGAVRCRLKRSGQREHVQPADPQRWRYHVVRGSIGLNPVRGLANRTDMHSYWHVCMRVFACVVFCVAGQGQWADHRDTVGAGRGCGGRYGNGRWPRSGYGRCACVCGWRHRCQWWHQGAVRGPVCGRQWRHNCKHRHRWVAHPHKDPTNVILLCYWDCHGGQGGWAVRSACSSQPL